MGILVLTKETKIVAIRHFLGLQYTKNAFVVAAPPQTPLWKLTELPRPPSFTLGATSQQRGDERKRENGINGAREEKGKRDDPE